MFIHYFRTTLGVKESRSLDDSAEDRNEARKEVVRAMRYSTGETDVKWIATIKKEEPVYKIPRLQATARELSARIKANVAIFQKSKSAEPNCVALNDAISDTRKLARLLEKTLSECQLGESVVAGDRSNRSD